jgi:hypothetical protein
MPVRRRRTQRVAKRQEAARVLRITDDGQWQKLQSKLGDRLLLIHFSAVRSMQQDALPVLSRLLPLHRCVRHVLTPAWSSSDGSVYPAVDSTCFAGGQMVISGHAACRHGQSRRSSSGHTLLTSHGGHSTATLYLQRSTWTSYR